MTTKDWQALQDWTHEARKAATLWREYLGDPTSAASTQDPLYRAYILLEGIDGDLAALRDVASRAEFGVKP